jgi:hypothetical protein
MDWVDSQKGWLGSYNGDFSPNYFERELGHGMFNSPALQVLYSEPGHGCRYKYSAPGHGSQLASVGTKASPPID